MPDAQDTTRSDHSAADEIIAWLIGPILLGLAAWFLVGGVPADVPIGQAEIVPVADILSPPRDSLLTDPPTIDVAGFEKQCMECHALFTSTGETPLRLNQHRNIVQGHGMNDRCFNCHDYADRNKLVLPGGELIGFADTHQLCATCHGPTYRDWQVGMHGRTTGSWDETRPDYRRLSCTQCHDPHAPAFAPMHALPGPHTLRMGTPSEHGHDPAAKRNPLRHWSERREGPH